MEFETGTLRLRRPKADDVQAWLSFFQSNRAKFQGGGREIAIGTAWRVFAAFAGHWQLNGCGPFVVTVKGTDEAIGLVGPWFPADWPERELSWSIWHSALEGQGYAFEAVRAVRAHVFNELGWPTAVSYIDPHNKRSIALARRLGCYRDDEASRPGGDHVLVYRHIPDAPA